MFPPRHYPNRDLLVFGTIVVLGLVLYFFHLTSNPAGFFVDESSIAYNAFTISRSGRDEFGNLWPLFFQAFGDYKNPVYIYLLALIFKLTGPSILVARSVSAIAGVAASVVIGRLAGRVTQKREVSIFVTLTALLTPWLFEISRVTLEVALYPLILGLFLAAVWRASKRPVWTVRDVTYLVSTLTLLTYTYSIGRLLGPLFAVLLVWFYTRSGLSSLIKTWVAYLLTLFPMFVYQLRHSEALTSRFKLITYIRPESSPGQSVWQFARHYAANLDPRKLLLTGDPNVFQVVHVAHEPALLFASFVLMLVSLVLIVRQVTRWWGFVVSALFASIIPASLTLEYFHMLRLVALPVFALLLMSPALQWLLRGPAPRRAALLVFVVLVMLQGALFQRSYHAAAANPWRRHLFDADYHDRIFTTALATGSRPIYLDDAIATPYIQAYWYATLGRVPLSTFIRLTPQQPLPTGSIVISAGEACFQPHVLAQVEPYLVYVAESQERNHAPLPENAFRATLSSDDINRTVSVGALIEFDVRVKNESSVTWPGCTRGPGELQLYLGSHWLDSNGNWTKEEGRTPVPKDLSPGDAAMLKFVVAAPAIPGDYQLQIDLLQEGVTWFGVKGSSTLTARIKVE